MNAQKYVVPFKKEVVENLEIFSDVTETIERWIKVQMLWSNLEAVFLSGDIAKAMPMESKKFQQIDKNWIKIMERANETQ